MRQITLLFNDDGTLHQSRADGYPGQLGRKIDGRLLTEDLLRVLMAIMNSGDASYVGIQYRMLIQPHIAKALEFITEKW